MAYNTNRTWSISDVEDRRILDLARDLSNQGLDYVLCQGFRVQGRVDDTSDDMRDVTYLILNDSISEDSIGEWVVVREDTMAEIESISFGLCGFSDSLTYLHHVIYGEYDNLCYGHLSRSQIQSTDEHGLCFLCG